MNNKGFTLIEILAVVVILSLITLFTGRTVLKTIENTKNKSEEVFADKIASLIDDYINYVSLNGDKFNIDSNSSLTFDKCSAYGSDGSCKDSKQSTAYLLKKNDGFDITLRDLVNTNLINENDLLNPKTKERCSNIDNTRIYLFKDTDYVYYYFVNLEDSCGVGEENNINTLPSAFCNNNLNSILGEDNFNKICTNEV